ncbi:hypothetical protein SAY87_006528 [Trapa incisa]|uniref:Uncharacterized protein n=1 Tax=Trapa incisa TaxID=236973 RepID=A0AAN7JYT7_9MYRT|nr:hypothetical protein SAY87_006528 [Trapa incisa]
MVVLSVDIYLISSSNVWVQTKLNLKGKPISARTGGIVVLPMTDASIVVGTIDRVIAFDGAFLCSARVLKPSAFIVSGSRSDGSYQKSLPAHVLLSSVKLSRLSISYKHREFNSRRFIYCSSKFWKNKSKHI